MNEGELYQRLLPRLVKNEKGETVTNRYVVLQRKVADETWQKIQMTMTNLSFGVDEKKLSRDRPRLFPQFAHERDFCRPGGRSVARVSERLAGGAGARLRGNGRTAATMFRKWSGATALN